MFDLLTYYLVIMNQLFLTNPSFLSKLPGVLDRPEDHTTDKPILQHVKTYTMEPLTYELNIPSYNPGNLILDTGSGKSHSESEEHMMPMMHFNPYHFYPMQQQHPQPMMMHPIYLEDHSAMQHHQHHYEPQHQEHHEQPQQHHVEMEHHEQHHEEPEQHHVEMHMPMQHMEHQEHHHPMSHYEHEPQHHDEEQHGGYETNPMVQFMMQNQGMQHAASGGTPEQMQQLASLQAFQNPLYLHQMQQAVAMNNRPEVSATPNNLNNQQQQQQQASPSSSSSNAVTTQKEASPPAKKFSLLSSSANNPLISIIKPLFKRDPNKNKKP